MRCFPADTTDGPANVGTLKDHVGGDSTRAVAAVYGPFSFARLPPALSAAGLSG